MGVSILSVRSSSKSQNHSSPDKARTQKNWRRNWMNYQNKGNFKNKTKKLQKHLIQKKPSHPANLLYWCEECGHSPCCEGPGRACQGGSGTPRQVHKNSKK